MLFSIFNLAQEYDTQAVAQVSGLSVKTVEMGPRRAEILRQPDTAMGTVVENKLLTSPNAPAKRHLGAFSVVNHRNFYPLTGINARNCSSGRHYIPYWRLPCNVSGCFRTGSYTR